MLSKDKEYTYIALLLVATGALFGAWVLLGIYWLVFP